MTRLKQLWPRLNEDSKDHWREQLDSNRSLDSIREEINTSLGLQLQYKIQLSRFRQWLADQDDREREEERMRDDERRFTKQFANASLDEIREKVLRRSYARTIGRGDFELGLRTLRLDQYERTVQLAIEKQQFKASKACLKILPKLKLISNNPKLSDTQKIDLIRLKLFGKIVPAQPPSPCGANANITPTQKP